MRILKNAYLAVLLAAILPLQTTLADGGKAQSGSDRYEIEALMWHYARALDTYNADAYAALFTEDGQFKAGPNATKGRKALWDMIENYRKGIADRKANGETVQPMYHMNADTHIEFIDDDHALHHSYWFTVVAGSGPDSPTTIIAAGVGVDEVVRVDGKWLIKSRDVSPQD